MCRPLSGFVAFVDGEPKLYVSETSDSHTDIADEFGLKDTPINAGRLFAWECYPDEECPTPDTSQWPVLWDSDATAGCREQPTEEQILLATPLIQEAAGKYVFTGNQRSSTDIIRGWLFDSSVNNSSGGEQWLYGNSVNNASGGSQWLLGNSVNNATGGSQWLYGNSVNNATGGSQRLYGNSVNNASGGRQVIFIK